MPDQPTPADQATINQVNDLIKKVGIPPMVQWRERMRKEEGDEAADSWYEGLDDG